MSDPSRLAEERLDGAIDDATWAQLLAQHGAELDAELARAQELRAAIRDLPRASAPADLRARIATAIRAEVPAATAAAPPPSPRPLRFPRWGVPLALAAAVLVAMTVPFLDALRSDRSDAASSGDAIARGEQRKRSEPVLEEGSSALAPAAEMDQAFLQDKAERSRGREAAAPPLAATPSAAHPAPGAPAQVPAPSAPRAIAPATGLRPETDAAHAPPASASASAPASAPIPQDGGTGAALQRALPAPAAPDAAGGAAVAAAPMAPKSSPLGGGAAPTRGPAASASAPPSPPPPPREPAAATLRAEEHELAELQRQARDFQQRQDANAKRSDRAPARDGIRPTAPGPLTLELAWSTSAETGDRAADAGNGARGRSQAPAAGAAATTQDLAKAEAADLAAAPAQRRRPPLRVTVANRSVGPVAVPAGTLMLVGLDARGDAVWTRELRAAETLVVAARATLIWSEPLVGEQSPPAAVVALRLEAGTQRSAAVPLHGDPAGSAPPPAGPTPAEAAPPAP